MSEREELMQLIRNEYDPRPNLGKADYPGFEWDDGAGRIADAIMADKTLLRRKHADEIATLRASSPAQEPITTEPVAWFVEGARPLNHSEVFMHHENAVAAFSTWGGKITPLGPLAIPAPPQPGRDAVIEECAKVAESFRRQMLPGDDRILIRKIEDAIRALTGESK